VMRRPRDEFRIVENTRLDAERSKLSAGQLLVRGRIAAGRW
jgi:hypothetical protein